MKKRTFMWWGKVKVKVTQLFPTLCIDPRDYTVHGIVQAEILEWVAFTFSRGSPQPRDQSQISAFQVDSLPAEPQGKSKNTGVFSLFLLQGIFLTQELTQGLLHCRQTLYQRGNKNQSKLIAESCESKGKWSVEPKGNGISLQSVSSPDELSVLAWTGEKLKFSNLQVGEKPEEPCSR